MIIIAENINVMNGTIGAALRAREKAPIQDLARRSVAAGADVLDVNIGPARKDGEGLMIFVIDALDQECMRTVRLVRALSDKSLYSVSDAELQ